MWFLFALFYLANGGIKIRIILYKRHTYIDLGDKNAWFSDAWFNDTWFISNKQRNTVPSRRMVRQLNGSTDNSIFLFCIGFNPKVIIKTQQFYTYRLSLLFFSRMANFNEFLDFVNY